MKKFSVVTGWLAGLIPLVFPAMLFSQTWTPIPVEDDPLVRMPGSQPADGIVLEAPNRCLNCHSGYDPAVEPGTHWQGSMMAQASRDFLFWACMAVAEQDSVWAVGTPNAGDICLRCHFPGGWLGGRSDPVNVSRMTADDFDGVSCDVCHSMYDPFFDLTHAGLREGSDWTGYWDESGLSGTPSQAAADATRAADWIIADRVKLYNETNFFTVDPNNRKVPSSAAYTENASGQFFVSDSGHKRAPFADASARHTMYYSRYHKSRYMCSTCHDVSNPVLANLGNNPALPLTAENQSASSYYHVERTFSEFMLSDYALGGGSAGLGPFAPGVFNTSMPGDYIASCQDCHMRDVTGKGCDKNDGVVRPTGSTEHPKSGQPLHDLTGGNVFVTTVLASAVPGSPNYDALNNQLLNQGPAVLTLDLTQGLGLDHATLLAGAARAQQQLLKAAAITSLNYDRDTGVLTFRVQNQTGHKLISGFPEGRRMFLNIRAYDESDALLLEINPFDTAAGTLKGLTGYAYGDPDATLPALPSPAPLNSPVERHEDALVFEAHPSSNLTGEDHTFHFALADGRSKDNRIPPKGFRIAEAAARQAQPVWHGADAPSYFTAAEYAGGYDEIATTVPAGTKRVDIKLLYQTTSREYVEFLRNEIKGTGALTLADPSPMNGLAAYRIQTDPFFAGFRAWGDTIWLLWKHNYQSGVAGAVPFEMAFATLADVPVTLSAFAVE